MVVFIFIINLIEHYVSAVETASDLGLHCLHMSHKNDARRICVHVFVLSVNVVFP